MFGIVGGTFAKANSGRSTRRALRRGAVVTVVVTAAFLALAGNAFAVSGTPINVGTPFSSGPPAVAVDSSGTAYIAWANTRDLAPVTTNIVQFCVLPPGATACTHSGNLVPANGGQYIDGVQVLVDGATVLILADVYGTTTQDYTPLQEWQSTDGGATFNIVNGGLSVGNGNISAGTGPVSGLIVPGTNVLGFGWVTAAGPPTFDAFPLTSPPECSKQTCPGTPFATLQPNTNPDQITNPAGAQYASQPGANPGVLAVFPTLFSNGPLGCTEPGTVGDFGTAYAYGSGTQSAGNSYNVSPGTPGSAWKVAVAQADCGVEYSAVAGGPSGFGVVEHNIATNSTVYHRFDQTTLNFDTPQVTIARESEQSPAVSQDGAGGVYVTYLAGGTGGPIRLAYSNNGGASWTGPGTLSPDTDLGAHEVTSSVAPTGQGWATWIDNGSVYAQPFVAADAIPAPAASAVGTEQTAGATTGASITVPAGTVGETDGAAISGANAATATGTVTYALFSKSSCTASSKVFSGGSKAVAGGVAGASDAVSTALSPGKYYWQASYSGNVGSLAGGGNEPSTSACGSEVLTVGSAVSGGGSGTSNGTTVTITITCASTPCTVTITITIGPSKTTRAVAAKKKAAKTVSIATGTFKIKKKGKAKLHVKLTKAGKSVLKAHHGHLKATILFKVKLRGHVVKQTGTIKIK